MRVGQAERIAGRGKIARGNAQAACIFARDHQRIFGQIHRAAAGVRYGAQQGKADAA